MEPSFHSVKQAHKLCLDSSLHLALMVNMINALYHYLRRKVIKEPRSTSIEAAVARTWEAFRTADTQASFMPHESQPVAMQAMTPPPPPQKMELDAVRHTLNQQ